MRWPKLILLCAVTACFELRAETLEYSARPEVSNNFAEASFSCVIPAERPRAILFLAGGTDSDARPWLADPRWRAFAEKEHLALIATCLRGAGESYEMAAEGSGQALLDAIAAFARQSGQPEIGRLPLILYGHSAGAQFAFNFACWKPELVRTVVGVKSGPLSPPIFHERPSFHALFVVGERDTPPRVREVAQAFATGRSRGAQWCLAFQPKAGHDAQGCRELAEEFIAAVNAGPGSAGKYAALSALDHEMEAPAATDDPNLNWLPNGRFLEAWRSFAKRVTLPYLLAIPDDSSVPEITWSSLTSLPGRIEVSKPFGRFAYLVSVSGSGERITQATARTSTPFKNVTISPFSDSEWKLVGECDLRDHPLGPFKGELEVDLQTETGIHKRGKLALFTRLTGPVAVSPSSVYYGVVGRETTSTIRLAIRPSSGPGIRSCTGQASDPSFAAVDIVPSSTAGEYLAKCTIKAGTAIGPKNGHLTIRVETDRAYEIKVPYYGFVKK